MRASSERMADLVIGKLAERRNFDATPSPKLDFAGLWRWMNPARGKPQ
jgi:hypothetical protein